jgi:hypothetical protein
MNNSKHGMKNNYYDILLKNFSDGIIIIDDEKNI